ncbi:hypothetical protein L0152_31910 [bacterium]|nr:hypothetical protein [bacterium]
MGIQANDLLCPYCKSPLTQSADVRTCADCQTSYHRECWEANGHCSVFGCSSSKVLSTTSQTFKETQSIADARNSEPFIRGFKSILRWLLILPAAFGTSLVSNVVSTIFYYLASLFGHAEPEFWIQLINSGLAGYYFVYGGTKTAPTHRPVVAIVLTVLYGIWEAFVVSASFRIGDDPSYPLWWFIVTTIVAIVAAIGACIKLQEQSD